MALAKRGSAALLAAAAAFGGFSSTAARAGDHPVYLQPAESATVNPNTAPARRPLMQLLDDVGAAGPLDDARIRFFGHVEGSYTYNATDPTSGFNAGRLFDFESEDLTLNQVSLNVERPVRVSANEFDWGFRAEVLYGSDARFTHANGLWDNHADDPNGLGPDEQWDLLQLYGDLNLPVANGLRVRLGKFVYFKAIDPIASPVYSRSFSFASALPFTLTGAYVTYAVNDKLAIDLGVSRGWDQSLEDNNDAIDAFGAVRYVLGDSTNLAVKWISGPELDDNSGAYRSAVDVTVTHKASDKLTLIGDALGGHQSGGADGDPFAHAWWYGVAGYGIYDLEEHVQLNSRLEWYRDEDGATTGLDAEDLFSATVGLTVTPFPTNNVLSGLKIRPEVRYDYATDRVFGGDYHQLTGAIEAYYAF